MDPETPGARGGVLYTPFYDRPGRSQNVSWEAGAGFAFGTGGPVFLTIEPNVGYHTAASSFAAGLFLDILSTW